LKLNFLGRKDRLLFGSFLSIYLFNSRTVSPQTLIDIAQMSSKSLTTKEVARLCRVSDATVKRWDESGLIHSERTNGGHRRFRAEEVARFQRQMGLGSKNCPGDESVITATTRRR